MTVSKINRVFTLAATAVLAMIVLSASSTNAAPAPPLVDGAAAKLGEVGGTAAGTVLPQDAIKGALAGYNDEMYGKYLENMGFHPVLDQAGFIIGYTLAKAGTQIFPATFTEAGAEAARKAAGL